MKTAFVTLLVLLTTGLPPSIPVILVLGDSVTRAGYTQDGYPDLLQAKLGNQGKIINAGINGGKAPDALLHYDEYSGIKPDVVIIYFGTNDVKRLHIGDETWEEYGSALVELATLAPHAILVTPHRGIENPKRSYYLRDVERAASLIRTLGYPVADLYPLCCQEHQMKDYAHPNEEGHRIIADAIFPLLPRQ